MEKIIKEIEKIASEVNFGNLILNLTIHNGKISKVEITDKSKIVLISNK